MERYCALGIARFVPAIKFRQSLSGCTKISFRKIFSVTVKRFSVISLLGWNPVDDHEFQEYILQQKPADTKVKTQSDMKAWNVK